MAGSPPRINRHCGLPSDVSIYTRLATLSRESGPECSQLQRKTFPLTSFALPLEPSLTADADDLTAITCVQLCLAAEGRKTVFLAIAATGDPSWKTSRSGKKLPKGKTLSRMEAQLEAMLEKLGKWAQQEVGGEKRLEFAK